LTVFGGKLYFTGTDGVHGKELWSLAAPTAPVPAFSATTRTSTGFTVQVANHDASYTWAVTSTVGTASISAAGLVTVSGVPANTSATATITSSKTGVVAKSATSTATSLQAAVFTPTVGLPTGTGTGFTVQITNYDASYTWTGTANFGTLTVSSTGLVTVSGVAALTTSIATIKASKAGFVPSTVLATATSLKVSLTPSYGIATSTADGFTVQITNYDASYTWTATSTTNAVTISATGLVIVTGAAAAAASTATISSVKTGHGIGLSAVTKAALTADAATADALNDVLDNKKVTIGTYKGYVAVFTKGYEGQKLSVRLASKWHVRNPIVDLKAGYSLLTVNTGAGYVANVIVYIDGVEVERVIITTR
jgi:titin